MKTTQNHNESLTEQTLLPYELVIDKKASSLTQGGNFGMAPENLTGPKRWYR